MQKIDFKNLPDTSTPINAENLNQMQTNVESAINSISGVIASGSDSSGNYIKFADGTLITAHQVSRALSITKAWGTLYETTEPADLGNYPIEFKNTPYVFLTLYNKDGICGSVKNPTNTHAGKVYISAPTTYEQTYIIQVLAIGRWK